LLSTKTKIAIAKVGRAVITLPRRMMGLGNTTVTSRSGIQWRLDLDEGIDLSIYLLGMFERSTVTAYRRVIMPDDTVLDIGANIGAHTLHFARCVGPRGRVVAFEPTDFAFQKLAVNVALNPDLSRRIRLEQVMLMDQSGSGLVPRLCSSWPLKTYTGLHEQHGGKMMETMDASVITLDDYRDRAAIKRIHFVKLDVDGYECKVLRGGRATLTREKPLILMELAPYLLTETGDSLEELLDLLAPLRYVLTPLGASHPLPNSPRRLRELIPPGHSINVFAKPN
jgi:FkbM family methyltransferase